MNPSSNIIKLAGAVKPPATKSEIIEALAIRKRDQIIKENEDAQAELAQLEKKIEIIAAEEMAANGKLKVERRGYSSTYNWRSAKEQDGSIGIGNITATYFCEPSKEFKEMARKIHRLKYDRDRHVPSLHEVKNQVRLALAGHTPQGVRVKKMLADPLCQQQLDAILAAFNTKPQLAITA